MKKTFSAAAALCALALAAPGLRAQEDLDKLYRGAVAQWYDGRPEDAAGGLKYVVFRASDTELALAAMKDISALLAEAGKNGEALPYLEKAAILAPEDFYVQFERGWNLLCLEKYQDARAAFEKARTLTADAGLVGQAGFGLALAEARLRGAAGALPLLRQVYTQAPQLLSPAAQLISFYLEKTKKRPDALNFIKESLEYDPRNIQAELDLARLYEDAEFTMAAWQTYYTLHELDPGEKKFSDKVRELGKTLKGRADDLLYWIRLSWPVHRDPLDFGTGARLRLGLYAGQDGTPSQLSAFSFIAASDFEIVDSRLGTLLSGPAASQWRVVFNPQSRLFEIYNSKDSAVRTAANNIRIAPKARGGVVLIKSPEFQPQTAGVNRGDKEISGELHVLIKEKGFWLVGETEPETMVSPISASLADRVKHPELLKTLAVTVRTRLAWLLAAPRHDSRDYHICDSAHCIAFPGLQAENEVSAAAAAATRGETLRGPGGAPAPAPYHRACGGLTSAGAADAPGRILPPTPFTAYSRAVEDPSPELLCLAEDRTQGADVSWTLLLRPKPIEDRLNRKGKVGYLKALVPLARDPQGRVTSLRAEGSAGTVALNGFREISAALGAGSLRSPLFTVRPLYYGKYPEFFLVRGIGTGDGEGLCLLGARGMAQKRGAKYRDILSHYFPELKLSGGPPVLKRGR